MENTFDYGLNRFDFQLMIKSRVFSKISKHHLDITERIDSPFSNWLDLKNCNVETIYYASVFALLRLMLYINLI